MATPLLQTKLYIPSPRPDAQRVPRPRLIERLDAGIRSGRKLTLISAPAGFGKTTLLSAWVATGCEPRTRVAWLSLDESDNDPIRFLAYLIGALQTIEANIGTNVLGALHAPQTPRPPTETSCPPWPTTSRPSPTEWFWSLTTTTRSRHNRSTMRSLFFSGVASKCDGCADEVDRGRGPTCVRACLMRALGYGPATSTLLEKRVEDWEFEDHGIGPAVWYFGRSGG